MAVFAYQAYTPDGRLTSGKLDAAHEREALQKLSLQGLVPFRATEVKPSIWQTEFQIRGRLRLSDLAFMLRNLSVLIEAAVPINSALRLAAEQAVAPRRKKVLDALHDAVVGGSALSIAPGEDVRYLLASLVVVIVGGMGSITGAAIGALLIGLAEQIGLAYFPTYGIVLTFIIMVAVLAFRPQGIMGRPA